MAIYSGFIHEKMVIFHSYVSLPEGTVAKLLPHIQRLAQFLEDPARFLGNPGWGCCKLQGLAVWTGRCR